MGSGPQKLQRPSPLTADTWYGIEVFITMDKVGFSINDKAAIFKRSGYTGPLDVDDIFHIGGVPSDGTPK
jgi:hypothetical protein